MPRSNRLWAVSLHDVAKCTAPNCFSLSSCALAASGWDAVAAAIAMAAASDVLVMIVLRICVSEASRLDEDPSHCRAAEGPWLSARNIASIATARVKKAVVLWRYLVWLGQDPQVFPRVGRISCTPSQVIGPGS